MHFFQVIFHRQNLVLYNVQNVHLYRMEIEQDEPGLQILQILQVVHIAYI